MENIENQISRPGLWLTIDELSDYIKLSQTSIRRLINKDKIPFSRLGNSKKSKIIFNRKQIDLWLLTGDKKPGKRARKLAKEFIND
ncbi:MAG: helix-turn-helix domain-containing protein [Candidatus Marinimicrobia bacterium]|nr:helix-turn-helix domain-containing protein [Candidatus Neomarinimicrobiota bacterium]